MALFSFRSSGSSSSRDFAGWSAALLLAVVVWLTAGCHPAVTDPTDPKFIVAEKGDWQITRGQLDTAIASFLKEKQMTPEQVGPANLPKLETVVLDSMVIQKLLLAKAATMTLKDVDQEEASILAQIKGRYPTEQDFEQQLQTSGYTLDDLKKKIHDKAVIDELIKTEALHDDDPTEQEIDQIYLENRDKFTHPPKVRASRILIMVDDQTSPAEKAAKKKAIDQARARVVHGEDFSKVAMEVSQDRYSAPRGGDINFFQRGENEDGFDEVAFNTKVGEISPVFQTKFGYQFLKVTAIQPAEAAPIAEARAYIAEKLRQGKIMQQENDYTTKLLADGNVTFHLIRVDLTPTPGSGSPAAPDEATAPTTNAPPAQ